MSKIADFIEDNLRTILVVLICITGLIFVAVIFTLVIGENGDRTLLISELSGNVFIVKSDGRIPATKNMTLESGDIVVTEGESTAKLRTDKNKYIYIEQDSTVYVYYTQKADRGSIIVNIQDGSVLCRLDNKLRRGSSFEVRTPDSIASVKGTVFHSAFDFYDRYNNCENVKVSRYKVLEGRVEIQLFDNNGEKYGVETEVTEGCGAELMTSEEYTGYNYVNQSCSLSEYDTQTLRFLIQMSGERQLPKTLSELNAAFVTAQNRTDRTKETTLITAPEITTTESEEFIFTEETFQSESHADIETEKTERTVASVTSAVTENTSVGSDETVFVVPTEKTEKTEETTVRTVTATNKTTKTTEATTTESRTAAGTSATKSTEATETVSVTTVVQTAAETSQSPVITTAETVPWWEIINSGNAAN